MKAHICFEMKLYCVYFICLLNCTYVHVFDSPNSLCPSVFQYVYDNFEWTGLISVPNVSRARTANLRIILTVKTILQRNYVGKIELINFPDAPIRYKLYFPLQSPLPMISEIRFNDNLLCRTSKAGGLVTEISLEHTSTMLPPNVNLKLNQSANMLSVKRETNSSFQRHGGKITPKIDKYLEQICGTAITARPLVVNGRRVIRGEYPWMVAIYKHTPLGIEFQCSGTLVTAKHIITAGHCLQYDKAPKIKVTELIILLGKFNLKDWSEPKVEAAQVAETHIHPEYRQMSLLHADLAILVLASSVNFNRFIRPACIWTLEPSYHEVGIIAGWGLDTNQLTTEARQIKMEIVSQETCLRSKLDFRYLTSNSTFCAGNVNEEAGPCNGDSGAGMVVYRDNQFYIRGVVSMALKNPITQRCDLKHYTIFTDLAKFSKWIYRTLLLH